MATAPLRRRRGTSAAAEAESESAETQRSFLFYQSIDSVTAEQHNEFCLAEDIDYGFASEINSLPLNRVEFSAAARHYPIIFNGEPKGSPFAVWCARTNENLFVEADNTQAVGCYLPAFVRRYPFIFISGEENAELAFCVDSVLALLTKGGDRALFQSGRSS